MRVNFSLTCSQSKNFQEKESSALGEHQVRSARLQPADQPRQDSTATHGLPNTLTTPESGTATENSVLVLPTSQQLDKFGELTARQILAFLNKEQDIQSKSDEVSNKIEDPNRDTIVRDTKCDFASETTFGLAVDLTSFDAVDSPISGLEETVCVAKVQIDSNPKGGLCESSGKFPAFEQEVTALSGQPVEDWLEAVSCRQEEDGEAKEGVAGHLPEGTSAPDQVFV
jgi:hypothetical protein